MSDKYRPIKCDYYDELEAWATTKAHLDIVYTNAEGRTGETAGLIKDLYVREHVEYLAMDNGTEIRLDDIQTINGRKM